MNKKIIGVSIAMLFAANGAFAQSSNGSSVELYGVLDVAVGTVNHSLSGDSNFPATVNPVTPTSTLVNNSTSGMFNGGISDSRWGIRGTEDLGGGLKAIFVLESGINLPSGSLNNAAASLANNRNATSGTVSVNSSLNGQLFNRTANVGLTDATMGTLTVGKNYVPMYDIVVAYDPVQAAQLFSPLGFSGGYGGGNGVSESLRQDNSLKYKNKIGDFNFGALYKLGGVSGSSSAQSAYSLNLGYEANGLGIQTAYQAYTDAMKEGNSAIQGDVKVTNYNTTGYMIAAKYTMGDATVRGGYEGYTLKAPSNTLASMGITSLNGFALDPASSNFATNNQTTNILWVGGDYNFSPAFNLAAGYYDIAAKATGDLKQHDGNIDILSMLADYHFTKRTDVYAGVMFSKVKGAQYTLPVVSDNSSNYIYAVGLRTKF